MKKTFQVLLIMSLMLGLGACSSNSAPASDSSGGGSTVFGDELSLTGYSLGSKDGHTEVKLTWKATRNLSTDYRVFVHALDSKGGIAFQGDHPLVNAAGGATSSWKPGDSVDDRFLMIPQGSAPAGAYPLRIGVYVLNPMRVLPLTQAALPRPTDDWKAQAILIANVECK